MAQLTDDCFAFSGPLLPIADMERLIIERVTPVAEVEEAPLDEALGRVIGADMIAPEDLPPFDNSAVDGFAVRHADLAVAAETRLVIAERVMAGHRAVHPLAPHEAIRIFTGAPMPAGAKSVPSWSGDLVHVPDVPAAVAAVRSRMRPGDVVLVKASHSIGLERAALALTGECPLSGPGALPGEEGAAR